MVTPDSSGLIAFDERDDVFWQKLRFRAAGQSELIRRVERADDIFDDGAFEEALLVLMFSDIVWNV